MNFKRFVSSAVLVALISASVSFQDSKAATLVGNAYIGSYNDWTDTWSGTPVSGGGPLWGFHLLHATMMENSDSRGGDGATNAGDFTPFILLQDGVTTGTDYSVNAKMFTSDDDGFGVVFGYVDADNYYRVSMRQQTSGSLGFTQGLSVQKVVGGVITQISPAGVGPGNTAVPTQSMIDTHEEIEVTVTVTGTSWTVDVNHLEELDGELFPTTTTISGSDDNLTGGKAGVHSWGQRQDNSLAPAWGTEVNSFTIKDGAGGTLFNDTFDDAAASPLKWRQINMTNAEGVTMPVTADDVGAPMLRLNKTIHDNSNGFEYATETAPNTDFIGPAIVVDEPGSENFSDYEMKVRMANGDNDGWGVLLRVQDDDTFYRVNIANQGLDSVVHRRNFGGVSVQKVQNGVWEDLYHEDQGDIKFVPGFDLEPFDLKVIAVGDKLAIQIIEDPDGAAIVHDYPHINDTASPILTGSVGLAAWGSGTSGGGAQWSAYGGIDGTPMLIDQDVIVPEPSSVVLLVLGALSLLGFRRK